MCETIYRCENCDTILQRDTKICPNCGSNKQIITVGIIEECKVAMHDQVSLNVKEKNKKKPILEEKVGSDYCVEQKKFVDKTRIIDREHNHYYEKVKDPDTGEIKHYCDEPLDHHFNHGSAKKKC